MDLIKQDSILRLTKGVTLGKNAAQKTAHEVGFIEALDLILEADLVEDNEDKENV